MAKVKQFNFKYPLFNLSGTFVVHHQKTWIPAILARLRIPSEKKHHPLTQIKGRFDESMP